MRVVIVGSGPAGVRVAERVAPVHSVTLFGEELGVPYNRVALSQVLAGDAAEDDIATPASVHARHRPERRVVEIDRAHRRVMTDQGDVVAYDRLVLATGADAVRLPLPGADQPHVVLYRTRRDVAQMLAAAEKGGEAVVIGGGLLGLEAAAGLARRGMGVTVLHAVDRVMERQLDHAGAALLQRRLRDQSIEVETEARTEEIETAHVRLSDGRRLPADLVVMAVGIRPRVDLARAAGLAVGRGVVVDDNMRTSDPAILAVGECAEHRGACVGLVAPALTQADTAASTILETGRHYRPVADAAALKVAGAPVWSGGAIDAECESIVFEDGAHAYRRLLVSGGRLVGAVMVGDTTDSAWYHKLIADGVELGALRAALPFGPAYADRGAE
jgi:nitrite reductase (NADH) large subunit